MTIRGQSGAAIAGLSAWLIAQGLTIGGWIQFDATPLLILAVVVPAFAALHQHALGYFAGSVAKPPTFAFPLQAIGALSLAIGLGANVYYAQLAGAILFAAGAIPYSIAVMKAAPKESLLSDDPLTKGDDACFKHVVFAHRFLPIAALLLVVQAGASQYSPVAALRLGVSAMHVLIIGFGLLSAYGISHLWIPRFSGIPAIAAGAIKGELHTTLLGLTGLVIGFLTGIVGIMAGLGFFVFVGFFTFMGVLGANMMKNKSKTHQVTPEFVYIPWTFTAIFWLISAVLMGLFLNVVPEVFAERYADLRHLHIAAGMMGGFVQLIIGLLPRLLPMVNGTNPPRFQGKQRGAFFAFNGGLILWLYAGFTGSALGPLGVGLIAISVLLLGPLANLIAKPPVTSA